MEHNEPLLLPPFSEEEALKRDVFQDLFALYESRILPPAKSDKEVIERIGEAFTIKKAILRQIQKEERMARRNKPETEYPEKVNQALAPSEEDRPLKTPADGKNS